MEQWIGQRPWVLIAGVVALGYLLGSSGSSHPRMRPQRTMGMLPFVGGSDPYPRMRTNDFAQHHVEPQRFSGGGGKAARSYAS